MVLDEPFLFSVSIRDNIAYGRPDADITDVEAAAIAAGADLLIALSLALMTWSGAVTLPLLFTVSVLLVPTVTLPETFRSPVPVIVIGPGETLPA